MSSVASRPAGSVAPKVISPLEFLTELAGNLSRGPVELPSFPNVVIKIRDALNDPSTSQEMTVKLIGAEPLLVARLLQTANSVAFNGSGKRITELKTAVIRLGQQLVQSAAMAFAVQQLKNAPTLKAIAIPLSELWSESIMVACLCQVIARRTKVLPDDAFLAGLMHGIGRLYIMAHAVGKGNSLTPEIISTELVDDWHPAIAKSVLENWDTNEEICEAVGEQANYDRDTRGSADLTDILIAGIVLSQVIKTQERIVPLSDVNAFARLGLLADDCSATMTHAELRVGSLQEALGC